MYWLLFVYLPSEDLPLCSHNLCILDKEMGYLDKDSVIQYEWPSTLVKGMKSQWQGK
jgi:hypothetical protein